MRAFIFPGQGSQAVGMGAELAAASAAARAVFEEVDEALGQHLSRLMADGPADALTLTENAQPAIMANALAVLAVLEREGGVRLAERAECVAGHSLGEYSALCAAGAFDLATAARLLRTRGRAMQAAVPAGEGAMAALIGTDLAGAAALCGAAAKGEVCQPANDNGGGQVVISGARAAVERAMALSKERGIKRAVALPVSAPFHCALMAPAADAMAEALAETAIRPPLLPVYANVSAAPESDPAAIASTLSRQRTVPVTIHVALADVPALLTAELIMGRARVTERGLQRDFGIAEPRIAVAGLNPHAGENGAIGREELDVVAPAIEQLRAEGMRIEGPLPADTMFHPRARARYDAALCLYHDQALIPVKALHFDEGVNLTLGLPIVRTAPDHGTAFAIAGRGQADPGAFVAAIALAGRCAEHRARAQ